MSRMLAAAAAAAAASVCLRVRKSDLFIIRKSNRSLNRNMQARRPSLRGGDLARAKSVGLFPAGFLPSDSPVTLLDLPPELLGVLVSAVKGKADLRRVCSTLKDVVDSVVVSITCMTATHDMLDARLLLKLPRLMKINVSMRRPFHCSVPLNLAPLQTCANLKTFNCFYTDVSSLGPLSNCRALTTLNCHCCRSISSLANCASLTALNCSDTAISSLQPLAICTALTYLDCSSTAISSLAPLASCTALASLSCVGTAVNSLAPLAACTALTCLTCDEWLDIPDFLSLRPKVQVI